jgi:hypothetical protein
MEGTPEELTGDGASTESATTTKAEAREAERSPSVKPSDSAEPSSGGKGDARSFSAEMDVTTPVLTFSYDCETDNVTEVSWPAEANVWSWTLCTRCGGKGMVPGNEFTRRSGETYQGFGHCLFGGNAK